MKYTWEVFAFGGIRGIAGLAEGDYALAARPESNDRPYRGWGFVTGQKFEVEASSWDAVTRLVEQRVSKITDAPKEFIPLGVIDFRHSDGRVERVHTNFP